MGFLRQRAACRDRHCRRHATAPCRRFQPAVSPASPGSLPSATPGQQLPVGPRSGRRHRLNLAHCPQRAGPGNPAASPGDLSPTRRPPGQTRGVQTRRRPMSGTRRSRSVALRRYASPLRSSRPDATGPEAARSWSAAS